MSVGKTPSRLHQQLGRELARIRKLAGIEQEDLARTIGVSQSKLSRTERGLRLPPLPEVRAWTQACDASPGTLERLLALTESAFTQTEPWTELFTESSQLQDAVRLDEATVGTLLSYTRTVVPGLLQTAAYADAVLQLTNYTGQMDIGAALAGRWRRQEALTDRMRRFEFVIAEAVLHWAPYGRTDVLATQLERLVTVAQQDNILLGVVASGTEPVLPFIDFTIYDNRTGDEPIVVSELVHGYVTAQNPRDVMLYREIFNKSRDAAVCGPDAVALIQRVAAGLRDRRD